MGVKYVFVTGGVVSGLGKGITAASAGTAAQSERISCNHAEAGSLYQCGSRYDESDPARRGICNR